MAAIPQKEILRRTIESLEASVRSRPDNEKLVLQLAYAYLQGGHFHPRALTLYEKASEYFPSDPRLQRAVAVGLMINQGRELMSDCPNISDLDPSLLGRCIDQLDRLSQEFPESPDILRALGDLQLIRGEYRAALQHYRSALALGICDLKPLVQQFEAVARLFDLPPNVCVFFADIYQRLGHTDDAWLLYRRLVEQGEPEPGMLESYYDFLTRQVERKAHDSDRFPILIREICTVAILRGAYQEALTWARQVGPDVVASEPALVKRLARLLIDMEDYRQAFDYLSKIAMDQEAKALLNEITVLLEKRGELDTAVYLLQFINEQELSPNQQLADPLEETVQNEEEAQRRVAYELEVQTELSMAELHWKNKRWQSAFEAYLRVLELGYDDYLSIIEPLNHLIDRVPNLSERQLAFLANFFAEKRDWRRALHFAEMALFLDPGLEDIRQRLMQACEQILLKEPNEHAVRLKLGELQLERGNVEAAMKEYRKVASQPEFGMKANRSMAQALFKAGDLKAALQKYQALPVLTAEDLEQLYDLMVSFQNKEQWKNALDSAALIRDFDNEFRDIAAKIKLYEEGVSAANAEFAIDPKMRELIGDHSIGRYKYVGKIGSGGMGVVHKVLDLKSGDVVAMKILRESLSSSDKAIDRFFREARIAATLHHVNIVNILDYNISNVYGQSYIAMEFVDGPSLRDIVEDRFQETMELTMEYVLSVLDWAVQLCSALDATHRKGIIHRDIKPDNIMIAGGNVVKVTDFGIVHIEEATFTPTGALIGTPRYMSPEQVHGGRIDARSDIYAVGIIIYEMLIGSPPFISGDIAYQQVNVLPTPPREICPQVPAVVDGVVMKCLEKSPNDRFQSSLELRAAVAEVFVANGGNPERLNPNRDYAIEVPVHSPDHTFSDAAPPSDFGQPSEMLDPPPKTPPKASRTQLRQIVGLSEFDNLDSESGVTSVSEYDAESAPTAKRRSPFVPPPAADAPPLFASPATPQPRRQQTSSAKDEGYLEFQSPEPYKAPDKPITLNPFPGEHPNRVGASASGPGRGVDSETATDGSDTSGISDFDFDDGEEEDSELGLGPLGDDFDEPSSAGSRSSDHGRRARPPREPSSTGRLDSELDLESVVEGAEAQLESFDDIDLDF
ncbi:MAG: protein kinase [Sumerlaeia bacterium]